MTVPIADQSFLVTGGVGFIGNNLVRALLKQGVKELRILDNWQRAYAQNIEDLIGDPRCQFVKGSVTDAALVQDLSCGAAGIFHVAALSQKASEDNPELAFEVNVQGTENVLNAARKNNVAKVVFSSSSAVYGESLGKAFAEEDRLNGQSVYAQNKIAAEQRVMNSSVKYAILRYMNIYGPYQDYQSDYVAIVIKMVHYALQGRVLQIYGDGQQGYDFVHASDAARANILAMEHPSSDGFFNVASGQKTSLNDLATLVRSVLEIDLDLRLSEGKSYVLSRVGDTRKAQDQLGFRAETPLNVGIEQLAEWLKSQVDVCV